jgi:hypothetical protein
MRIQSLDSALIQDRIVTPLGRGARQSYYAEVPAGPLDEQSQLIEQVIRFALDTLGARYLDVRVVGALDTLRESA